MILIYLMFIIICILLYISYRWNNRNVIAPSFIFTLSFIPATLIACLYKSTWTLNLHINTFLVITGGILEFIIVCKIVQYAFNLTHETVGVHQNKFFIQNSIPNIITYAVLLICIFTLLISLKEELDWAGLPITSIVEASRKVDQTKFSNGDGLQFSNMTEQLRAFLTASTYFYGLLLANYFAENRKIKLSYLFILLCSIPSNLMLGSRGGLISLAICIFVYYLIILQKNKNKEQIITRKMFVAIFLIAIVCMILFKASGQLMQRSIDNRLTAFDYLAIYMGAEIKNLDLFLQEPRRISRIWGSQTFRSLVISIGKRIGWLHSRYKLDLPYRKVNGFNLGNVYTVFYPFIYDFGYVGCIILVALMAAISQIFFENVKNSKNSFSFFICFLIYGHVAASLIMSFFSNKFYEENFTFAMVKMIIIWILCYLIYYHTSSNKKIEKIFQERND